MKNNRSPKKPNLLNQTKHKRYIYIYTYTCIHVICSITLQYFQTHVIKLSHIYFANFALSPGLR